MNHLLLLVYLTIIGLIKDLQMNHQTELQIAKEMGTNDDYGTTAQQIAKWLDITMVLK